MSHFFHAADGLAALEPHVAELLRGKGAHDTVRVWVPGCAGGEEAYAVAMLLAEHAATLQAPPVLQVIGTDADGQAIRAAREGVYPAAIGAGLGEARLWRFFDRDPRGWRVRRELRELVLFAVHDLLRDPPFAPVDLVSCRGLLAASERDTQERALAVLRGALAPQGRLVGDATGPAAARGDQPHGVPSAEEQLRLVVESARDYAIFSIDMGRRVTTWNAGAERLLGYDGAEVLGRSADLIFIDEDRAAGVPEQEVRTALAEGRAADDRLHRRKDGSLFWASGMCMPMRDAQGRAVGFVKVLRDQTAERQGQQALQRSQAELIEALADAQRARQQLEAADAAKDRFLAVLSHELRNPLASIASASELLLMPKLPEAALEKAAQVVQRQARAMKVLLDELLDVSRLTLGRLTLSRRPVAVTTVIQSALEATRPLVLAAGHELAVRLPEPTVQVDGDPLRLAQVVSNLVSNAAKYTPEGGRIGVSAEVLHDEVVIAVEDNGIGMKADEIGRMFDLFSQGEGAAERAHGGLGIGLALARNIVELHGGWIVASSAGPGLGSQLRVGLPLLRTAAAVPDAPVTTPAPQPHVPATAPEGELVLVADDNGDAAWGLAKLLELSGFRAVLARGGEEALRLAEAQRPAIALLDIGMPDLSGLEVARRLRRQDWGRAMVLIAATGWGQESDVRQSLQAGFDAHLTKPLNVGRIKSVLEEIAQRRQHG